MIEPACPGQWMEVVEGRVLRVKMGDEGVGKDGGGEVGGEAGSGAGSGG